MKTPKEFAFLPRTDAVRLGVPVDDIGSWQEFGCLFCEDGERFTLIGDPEYLCTLIAARGVGVLADLEIPRDKFPLQRRGWPDEWNFEGPEPQPPVRA